MYLSRRHSMISATSPFLRCPHRATLAIHAVTARCSVRPHTPTVPTYTSSRAQLQPKEPCPPSISWTPPHYQVAPFLFPLSSSRTNHTATTTTTLLATSAARRTGPLAPAKKAEDRWYNYILLSPSSQRTYNGVTNDLNRRLRQHRGELSGGAKSTRCCCDWCYLAVLHHPAWGRSEACAVEYRVRYPTGRRPRPARFSGPAGRLASLELVLPQLLQDPQLKVQREQGQQQQGQGQQQGSTGRAAESARGGRGKGTGLQHGEQLLLWLHPQHANAEVGAGAVLLEVAAASEVPWRKQCHGLVDEWV